MRLSGLIQPAVVWKNHVDGSITSFSSDIRLRLLFPNMARKLLVLLCRFFLRGRKVSKTNGE